MTKRTLKALRASIAHWRRLSTGRRRQYEDICADECALCEQFANEFEDKICIGCPVMNRTGQTSCLGSPYWKAKKARWNAGLDSELFKAAARKELAFLESLLPRENNR